jgi:hypothetical protein
MNIEDLRPLVAQYRAGLEAEMTLLHRLEAIAARQRETSENADIPALAGASDERDRVMAGLVTIEHELKPIRMTLLEHRTTLDGIEGFRDVVALHHTAADLVDRVVTQDQHSLDALKDAEIARRFSAQALGQSESTLAAYRRVVASHSAGPSLVNRRG